MRALAVVSTGEACRQPIPLSTSIDDLPPIDYEFEHISCGVADEEACDERSGVESSARGRL